MKLIKVDDNGNETVFNDVLTFGFWDKNDVQNIAENYGSRLTDNELETFVRRCDKMDSLPDYEQVSWTISDILE